MTDVVAVIIEMSWLVKSAWLVWLAWLAVQVAWYQRRRLASSDSGASAPVERLDARRRTPVDATPHPPADAVHAPPSSHRRRRRARRAPAVTTDLADTSTRGLKPSLGS